MRPAGNEPGPGVRYRAYWLKTLHRWHWISAALCLVGMLLFAVTGITLNHAAQIKATPRTTTLAGTVPAPLLDSLRQPAAEAGAPLPQPLRDWLAAEWSLRIGARPAEWSEDELYLSLPRPGGDAWLSIALDDGAIEYERTDRGWIAYFNDLHKGRNTGLAWSWFLDAFAVATIVFTLTGLFLLQLHAGNRPATWPVTGLGFLIPLLLALLFIH